MNDRYPLIRSYPLQLYWFPLILCLIAVLALLVVRGDVPGERAYAAFYSARLLASGGGNLIPSQISQPLFGELLSSAPLFVALLATLGHVGLPIPQVGLVLSTTGWLVTIIGVYSIGLRFNRVAMAIFAAAALVLEPSLYQLLGQDALFVMGWLWGGLALAVYSHKRRWLLVPALVMLSVLVGSALYQAGFLSHPALWETHGAAMLPALALLTGLGVDWVAGLAGQLRLARTDQRTLATGAIILALIGLGYARGSIRLLERAPHAAERVALWAQAGLWLKENTPPEATVLSDESGTLGYFSERRAANSLDYARDRQSSPGTPPDYCVTSNSLAWAERVSQPWFQEHYRPVHAIVNPYDSITPLTIWRYRPSPFEAGPAVDVGARFGQAKGEKIELMNYRLDSTQVMRGQAHYLVLTWQALEPLTRSLSMRVRLYDPEKGHSLAQVDNLSPAGLETTLWPPGQPLTDRYILEIPEGLSSGTYLLDVRVYAGEVEHYLPVNKATAHSVKVATTNSGEQLVLAQLELPAWVSQDPLQAPYPLTARFGDAIELTGYDLKAPGQAAGNVERGDELRVRLYWHALAPPGAAYQVFTHLLTDDGRLVAQHDSAPVFATYSTDNWQAGEYILDEHPILIDSDTPPGRYWLKVGLYPQGGGERLVVRDQAGGEVPDRSLLLTQVQVYAE